MLKDNRLEFIRNKILVEICTLAKLWLLVVSIKKECKIDIIIIFLNTFLKFLREGK